MKDRNGICLISFSNNADHQNGIFSMYDALKDKANVYTISVKNPKIDVKKRSSHNLYYDCPLRPGIEKKTFRIDVLFKMAKKIRKSGIKYLYFENMHIWNAALMILCPQCIKLVAVHDVIPHDENKAMDLANYVICKLSNHIILRNKMYKKELSERLHIPESKITCLNLWRYYPDERKLSGNKIFMCFGRIRKYKGFDQLIQIVKKVPEAKFLVVGAPDTESEVYVEALKSQNNVKIVPREVSDEEMNDYFEIADWLVLPYSSATQSGVIVDGCRLSRPSIAFDVGAISEQIINGKTGFLIPRGNVDVFAERIKFINDSPLEMSEKMASAAYNFGYEQYSAEALADPFIKVIYGIEEKKHKRDK